MKRVINVSPQQTSPSRRPRRARRVGIAEAKAKLSQVLRSLVEGPVVIHNRGRDMGALVDIDAYERLLDESQIPTKTGGAAFVEATETLKRRYGGGVDDFEPSPAVVIPLDPFRKPRRK